MTIEEVHDRGIQRHGSAWARANQRAVESLTGSDLKPWSPGVKEAMPRAVLKILDGLRLDAGEEWLAGASEWTPRRQQA